MIGNNLRSYAPVIVGSVLVSLFALFAPSVSVSAQDAPNYLLGNLTFEKNPTKEQIQEAVDKVKNYTNTMVKAANGNETKLSMLIIEDLTKRNIIDENAKQGFLSVIATIPKPHIETLPGTIPGNLTIPGDIPIPANNTEFLKELDTSSAMLDNIANNNSDSQVVTLMTDILKKRVTDIGAFVSGNVTDTGPVTISGEFNDVSAGEFAEAVVCTAAVFASGNLISSIANGYSCVMSAKYLNQ